MVRERTGFTIVELLIVIVIIAILAAITIVAYNGFAQRARNAQTISGVKAYEKALRMYAIDNDVFPAITSACLGEYSVARCWDGANGVRVVNASLDNLLSVYIGSNKPVVSTKVLKITNSPDYRLGAIYTRDTPTSARINYYLEGPGQICLSGSAGMTELEGTQCSVTINI